MWEKPFFEYLSFQPAEGFSEIAVFRYSKRFRDQLVAAFADQPENLRVVRGYTLAFAGFGECHRVSGIAAEQRAIDIEDHDFETTHRMGGAIRIPLQLHRPPVRFAPPLL